MAAGIAGCTLCGCERYAYFFSATAYYDIIRCLRCGLVFLRRMPTKDELDVFYSSMSIHDPVMLRRREIDRWHARYLARLDSLAAKGMLLDVGCSFGFFLASARERGWSVKGVEVAGYPVGYGEKELGLDIFKGDLFEAHFGDEQFEAVTAWHVLEHTTDPLQTLREMRRILRFGGVVGLAVPNISSLAARMGGPRWEWLGPPSHLFYFSPGTLRAMLFKAGFEVVHLETCRGRSTPLLYWLLDLGIFESRLNVVGDLAIQLLAKGATKGNSADSSVRRPSEDTRGLVVGFRDGLLQRLKGLAWSLEPVSRPAQWVADRRGMGAEVVAFARKI